jgi:hypothetical protein
MNKITPIFLISLPRAGSTLVQRMLATHEDIATASEPWILLPYLYTLKKRGACSEYGHDLMVDAIEDFCSELPDGREDYLAEMRTFILRLYTKIAKNGEKYFLDKTPRYHLVVEEIVRLFPNAKFIFLWRNPLAIVASIMETWGGGRWNLYRLKVDIYDGLANLVAAYEKHASKVYAVRYEDLVVNTETEWRRLFNYLNLPFNPEMLSSFNNIKLKGRMGDPRGTKQYQSITEEPLEKWKLTLINPIRKAWCRRYLQWIGRQQLAVMGYDLDSLIAELEAVQSNLHLVGSDLLRISYGLAYCALEPHLMKHKIQTLPAWHRIHGHR